MEDQPGGRASRCGKSRSPWPRSIYADHTFTGRAQREELLLAMLDEHLVTPFELTSASLDRGGAALPSHQARLPCELCRGHAS